MKILRSLLLLIPFLTASSLFAADPLDFPDAAFRIKIGSQATIVRGNSAAQEIKIDGRTVRTGEILANSLKITWIVAPSHEIGDEYVFTVRSAKQKPKTYSAVFKGGYVLVASQDDLTIEIEN
jgi:hypothetical protein